LEWRKVWTLAGFWLFSALIACQKPTSVQPADVTIAQGFQPTVTPTSTLTPIATPSFIPSSPTVAITATQSSQLDICSPLEGVELERLPDLVSNPFNPPSPGSDDPHQGVDLADRLPGSQVALSGRAVNAILAGRVAGVIRDRFPYGNALLVESTFDELPEGFIQSLRIATPAPAFSPDPALTCPSVLGKIGVNDGRSLYVLYAHLLNEPELIVGESVACGQRIGVVGESGNALNPHLHVEVRLGPAGVSFESMAHYDNRATLEEMDAYCTWRVRGIFQLVDPMILLAVRH